MAKPNPMKAAVQTFRAMNPQHRFAAKVVTLDAPPAAAQKSVVGELYIYDAIGSDWYGGIGAKDVVAAIKEVEAAGATELNVYINSPGGDVFEGVAIYTALSRFKGAKHVYIDGLAASAASFIAMVGDDITTAFNAMWMVHNPWGLAIGNAAQMREVADMLDKVGGTMVDTYARRTKMSAGDIKSLLDAETWLTASEAKAKGFTDNVTEEDPEAQEEPAARAPTGAAASLLNKFQNTPASLRPAASTLVATMEERVMQLPKRASPPTRSKTGQPGTTK